MCVSMCWLKLGMSASLRGESVGRSSGSKG